MRWEGYSAHYYESFPVDLLNPFDIPERDGLKTGGMSSKKFLLLVESIKEKGLINPVVVEHGKRLTVAMGNNRVWAMRHLGETHMPMVLFAKGATLPEGGVHIPNKYLEARMAELHPGDNSWIHSQAARWIRRTVRQEPLE